MNESLLQRKAELLGSFLLFTRTFYQLRTGREFKLSSPLSRESHFITIAKAFTKVLHGEISSLLINIAPGTGKSELCKHFVAWALAHYADSNFIYVSYSHELAAKHTHGIKEIVTLPEYRHLFGVEIPRDSSAKANFKTTAGGAVFAAGSAGTITGYDAGLPHLMRFSGCLLMDDMHKPDEVHSDPIRQKVITNYHETILPRLRSEHVPILGIGQTLHEDDVFRHIAAGGDGRKWDEIILPSIDVVGNALYPEVHSKEMLLNLQEKSPYMFASQHQQNPIPAGGGIFKPDWFMLLDETPEILATFITADTAESMKEYADYTVFSFFGLYRLSHKEIDLNLLGLYWIDCLEARIDPKDLEMEFTQFWVDCMRFHVKPSFAAIETKSSGTTLARIMQATQGIQVIEIDRNVTTGNKATRFLKCQPYVASKQVALPRYGKHTHSCIEHMRKITANDTHRHDDIADTLADGIQLGLIDQTIYSISPHEQQSSQMVKSLAQTFVQRKQLRSQRYGHVR